MEKPLQQAIRSALIAFWNHRGYGPQRRAVTFILIFAMLLCFFVFYNVSESSSSSALLYKHLKEPSWTQLVADVPQYLIFAVADNDANNTLTGDVYSPSLGKNLRGGATATKVKQGLQSSRKQSALAEGVLTVSVLGGSPKFTVEWSSPSIQRLQTSFVHNGRGLELSTLQFWNGPHLYTCDDHTGIIYELLLEEGLSPRLVPRHILSDGDGRNPNGMRCEWSTAKGDFLMIGSTGQPWIDDAGNVVNQNANWIKTISPFGQLKHIDWTEPYRKMKRALEGVGEVGYLIHECGLWSTKFNRWYFIPRHVSNTPYMPGDEVKHGSTVIIVADPSFNKIVVNTLGGTNMNPTAGVTDCKFVPNGRDREIIIIKTDELSGRLNVAANATNGKAKSASEGFQSFVSIVNTEGEVLMEDVPMPHGWKFEGIELRPIIHSEK